MPEHDEARVFVASGRYYCNIEKGEALKQLMQEPTIEVSYPEANIIVNEVYGMDPHALAGLLGVDDEPGDAISATPDVEAVTDEVEEGGAEASRERMPKGEGISDDERMRRQAVMANARNVRDYTNLTLRQQAALCQANASGKEWVAYARLVRYQVKGEPGNVHSVTHANEAALVGMRQDDFTRALGNLCRKTFTDADGTERPVLEKIERGRKGHRAVYRDNAGKP